MIAEIIAGVRESVTHVSRDNRLVSSHFLTDQEIARTRREIEEKRRRLDLQTGAEEIKKEENV